MGVVVKKPTPQDNRLYIEASGTFDFESFRHVEKMVKWSEFGEPGLFVVDFAKVKTVHPWLVDALEKRLAELLRKNIEVAFLYNPKSSVKAAYIKTLRQSLPSFTSSKDLPVPPPRSPKHRPAKAVAKKKETDKEKGEATWLIKKKNGKIYGYFSKKQLKDFLEEGRLVPGDLISREKTGPWVQFEDDSPIPEEEASAPEQSAPPPSDETEQKPGVCVLAVTEGAETGREFILQDGPTTMGRGTEADLVFLDKLMSRTHCKIVKKDDLVIISDLGSTNGTFVNESKIETRELKDGDKVRLGGTVLAYTWR